MPQVGALFAAGALSSAIGGAVLNAAIGLAVNFGLSKLFPPKGPRQQEVQDEIRQADAPRAVHYGRVRVGGAVHFWDWTTESDDRYLYKLLAINTGEIDAFEEFYFNDTQVTVSSNAVTTTPYNGVAEIYTQDGSGEGGDYATLKAAFPTNWTNNHRLDGVATMLGRFEAVKGADISEVYPGGEPAMTAVIRGAKVYDPRTTTTAWSENVALQILDVLTGPNGRHALADMDLTSFEQAADDCEDNIVTGSGTIPRYVGGGTTFLNEPQKDKLARMLAACAGDLYRTPAGLIGLRVGKWRAPTYTIEPEHIVAIEGGAGSGEFEQVTALTPRFVSSRLDYQETTADPWEDSDLLALIGETEPKDFELPWVQDYRQARRLTKIAMARRNPKYRFTIRLRYWGLLLLDQENVTLNFPDFGISNEPFWIDRFSFDPAGTDGVVTVTLRHAEETSFDWTAAEEGDAPLEPTAIIQNGGTIPAPTISAIVVKERDGQPWIRATATTSTSFFLVGGFKRDDESEWTPLEVDQTSGVMKTPLLDNGTNYSVRMGYAISKLDGADVTYTTVTGTAVSVNAGPPDDPVLVSATDDGSDITFVFEPDVGSNYWRTFVMRGTTTGNAVAVETSYSTAQEVTITATTVADQSYWLLSQSYDSENSGFVFAISTASGGP